MITLIIIAIVLAFISGFSEGINNTLLFRYSKFKKRFPKANDQWWEPSVSWKNKHDNDTKLDNTLFSFMTDGFHATKFIRYWTTILACTAMAFVAWWAIPFLWIARMAGFHLTWTFYFGKA